MVNWSVRRSKRKNTRNRKKERYALSNIKSNFFVVSNKLNSGIWSLTLNISVFE